MSFAKSNRRPLLLALFGAATMMALPTPASAGTGCNGVVNIFVWGCAPWDNNNGAQYPYARKQQTTIPANRTQIVTKNGVPMALYNGQYFPIISNDGASIVASGAGNLRVWTGQ